MRLILTGSLCRLSLFMCYFATASLLSALACSIACSVFDLKNIVLCCSTLQHSSSLKKPLLWYNTERGLIPGLEGASNRILRWGLQERFFRFAWKNLWLLIREKSTLFCSLMWICHLDLFYFWNTFREAEGTLHWPKPWLVGPLRKYRRYQMPLIAWERMLQFS